MQLFRILITILSCLLVSALSVPGCSMLGKGQSDDGPTPTDQFSTRAGEPAGALRLFAGNNVNAGNTDEPLALVVKLYVLRDVNAFKQAGYDAFLDDGDIRDGLGSDLVEQRETLLVPSQTYETRVPGTGRYLGVVALFRSPANGRWRHAFKLSSDQATPIVIGLHACAMTVARGRVVDPPKYSLSRLTDVRCEQ